MRTALVLSFALLGCGGAPPPASTPRTPAGPSDAPVARDPAVPAPVPSEPRPERRPAMPVPLPSPRTVLDGLKPEPRSPTGPFVPLDRVPIRGRVGELNYDRKSDYWSPCVREFVQTQPESARIALGEALSTYSTSCTGGPARRIEFRTPRAGRTAPAQSYLGVVGALEPATCELALTAAYYGEPIRADRITLIADGVWWSSQRLAFDRDDGWEIATLPMSRSLVRTIEEALAARVTVLRFEGARTYEDVIVTDDMKQDLRAMLDALDAINRP